MKLFSFMFKTKNKMLDGLFPDRIKCVFCGTDIRYDAFETCDFCKKRLPFNNGKRCIICDDAVVSDAIVCDRCQNHHPNFKMARATFTYDEPVSLAVHELKYENGIINARPLAMYLAKTYNETGFKADVIIPIPLHEKRLKKRGYNQAELLAHELSKLIDVPISTTCLARTKDTPTQTKLGYDKRRENLKGAFQLLDKKQIKGKKVLLVDDVLTSGSTMNECAEVLKPASAVYAIAVCRTNI